MEPDFFGNEEEEEEEDDLEYEPGTASSLRSSSVSESNKEEDEIEEGKEHKNQSISEKAERNGGGKENLPPSSSKSYNKTPGNKQPLRLLFQNQTFKIEIDTNTADDDTTNNNVNK
ncbi:unnamed protein product [Bathycoccus prasinos]